MSNTPEIFGETGDAPAAQPVRKHSSYREMRERIEIVRRKLLAGATRKTVRAMISEEWGLKPTRAYWYLSAAEAEIKEAVNRDRDAWLAEHIAIRREIRRRANETNDLRMELAAADSEAKLLGLLPATKLEHSGPSRKPMESKVNGRVVVAVRSDLEPQDIIAANRLLGMADSELHPDRRPEPVEPPFRAR